MNFVRKLGISVVVLSAAFSLFADKYEIVPNHKNALYRAGELAKFKIAVRDDNGELITTGKVDWAFDNFGTIKLSRGSADLSKANPFKLSEKLDSDGFLKLSISIGTPSKVVQVFGVGYDVGKIRQTAECPDDFDEFWQGEKVRLEKEVPLDPKMTRDEKLSNPTSDVYRVNFATFNDKRVYGLLSIPCDKAQAPFRTWVTVPGAGPGSVDVPFAKDKICLVMNVHLFETEATVEAQKQKMQKRNAEIANANGYQGRDPYPSYMWLGETRDSLYYHDVILGINRAIDWVCQLPEVDKKRVAYYGSSQGGGFGLFLNYLNSNFSRASVAVCAITGHYSHLQNRQCDWPSLVENQPTPEKTAMSEKYAGYYDGVNFAARIRHSIRFIVAFQDITCPPHNVYAAFNACPSKDKQIWNCINSGHNWYKCYNDDRGKKGWFDRTAYENFYD